MYTLPCHILKHCPFNNFTAEPMKRHKTHSRRRNRCGHNGTTAILISTIIAVSRALEVITYLPMQLELEGFGVLNPGAKRMERKILNQAGSFCLTLIFSVSLI